MLAMRSHAGPTLWAAIGALTLSASVGCRQPGQPAGATLARVTVQDGEDFDRLWETAAEVLRGHNLDPDRQDRLARVITTYPDTSPQFWEFWRPFPTSDFGRAEANLQTIRRRVEVQFTPLTDTTEYEMSVRVDVERYCMVERQATSAAAAFQIFGAKLPTAEGRSEPRGAGVYWESIGRDEAMELALLDRILRRFGGEGRPDTTTAPAGTEPGAQTARR